MHCQQLLMACGAAYCPFVCLKDNYFCVVWYGLPAGDILLYSGHRRRSCLIAKKRRKKHDIRVQLNMSW